jgi:hypothetical protein
VTPYQSDDDAPAAPEEATVVRRSDRTIVVRGTVYGRNGCAELTWGSPDLDSGTLTMSIGAGYPDGEPLTNRGIGTQTPRRACTHVIKALPYEFRIRFSSPFRGMIDVTEGGYAFDPDRVPITEINES